MSIQITKSLKLSLAAFAGIALAGCKTYAKYNPGANFKSDLEALQGKKIFFAHQSVGKNILEGLNAIAPEFRATVQDAKIGKNGNPELKCEDFEKKLEEVQKQGPVDFALVKFCYVDILPDTDVPALAARYAGTIDGLKKEYPTTAFVPVTAPLMVRPPAWKRKMNEMLKKGDDNDSDLLNAKRNEFNALMLQHFAGEPVFDLAAFESTRPDGTRVSFEFGGKTVYSLAPEYSDDGGHLTDDAGKMAAEAFVHALAETARATSARTSPK